jgi:tetratricopeptide (TPR) repeat protein
LRTSGLLILAVALTACTRVDHSIVRLAILPFENLSGDPALDPIAAAAATMLAEQIVGAPYLIPIRAASPGDAYLAGATRLVFGTLTRQTNALAFEIDVEDAARHKSILDRRFRGSALDAIHHAALDLDPSARPFSTSNAEALDAWAKGDFERAVSLDPDFGEAWIAWAESLASKGQPSEALGVTRRALDRPALRSPLDRARIAVLAAELAKDLPARAKALADLQRLDPSDIAVSERLAAADNQLRDFDGAAKAYREILKDDPQNRAALLGLGYAEAFAGRIDAARVGFEQYGKNPDDKSNSLDSLGEAYFMNGHFEEAQKYFLEAHASNPNFLEGVDLEKAAYAQWLAGDLKKADAVMAQYLDQRQKARDPLTAWRAACWDFSTGRRDLAERALAEAPREIAARQLALWKSTPSATLDRLKQAYESSEPSRDGFFRTFYAAALAESGDRDHARQLIARWPLPIDNSTDPLLDSLVFPKFLNLRQTLK